MMSLLFACQDVETEAWERALRAHLGDIALRRWHEGAPANDVRFAMGWGNPPGFWAQFPRLEVIQSLGAGVEKILADPDLPPQVRVVRMIDPTLEEEMADFVLARVLHHHRLLHRYEADQVARAWDPVRPPLPPQRTIGMLGMGKLGERCARDLAARGFRVRGWSRTPRLVAGVEGFAGEARLDRFLDGCEILVCLLPLTEETRGILAKPLFDRLAPGACLINAGRGAHLIDADLLAALADGRIEAATLDVFHHEPLPADHPFWAHPAIRIFPHIAAFTHPETAAAVVADNLRRLIAGLPVEGLVDRARGY